jgi:hypothetical protein
VRVVVVMRVGICRGGGVVLVMCRVWKCHSVKDREMVGRSLIMGTVINWACMIWPMVGGKVADHGREEGC